MHLVTVTEPLNRGAKLSVGSYLADSINAGELLASNPKKIQAQHFENPKPIAHLELDVERSGAEPRILIIRTGGYGDLLFLAAAIRVLKGRNPEAHIAVASFVDFADVFTNNPDVAEIIPYPVPLAIADTFDAIVALENTIEDERTLHAVDRFLAELGIDPTEVPAEEKRCIYHPAESELAAALSAFPRKLDEKGATIPRLGVQINAAHMNRTYPHNLLAHLFSLIHGKAGWEIFLFGSPKSIAIQEQDRLVNLSARGLDFRRSAAVLATCDVVLAPDSSIAHLAGALDLPCVALYGPFPHQLRTAYHPKTFAMTGKGACAPCFHFGGPRQHWPEKGPCNESGKCDVLASLAPQRVALKIVALYQAAQKISEQRTAENLA